MTVEEQEEQGQEDSADRSAWVKAVVPAPQAGGGVR